MRSSHIYKFVLVDVFYTFPANRSAYLNLANLVYLFALIFWFRLSVKVGLVFLLIGFILSISTMLIWAMVYYGMDAPFARMAGVVFAIAWIGQFLGHRIEGKSPSFIKDLQFLLIGPIWVFRRK